MFAVGGESKIEIFESRSNTLTEFEKIHKLLKKLCEFSGIYLQYITSFVLEDKWFFNFPLFPNLFSKFDENETKPHCNN